MLTGIVHSHKYLGYLVGGIVILNFLLTIVGARRSAGMAKVVDLLGKIGLGAIGGIVMLAGIYLWVQLNHGLGALWIWGSIALWAPVAVLGKRMVGGEAVKVQEGGEGSSRMVLGAFIQLLCVVAIIGMMTVKPGMG